MIKLIRKERILFYFLFIIAGIFCNIYLLGEATIDNDVISVSTSAKYIVLIINNIYITYLYVKSKKVKSVYDKIIIRVGTEKIFNQYIMNAIIDICFFQFITYFIVYLKVGINLEYISLFIVFLVLNTANFFLQELISTLVFTAKKGEKYIFLPILMNLIFHYYIVPILVGKFFMR